MPARFTEGYVLHAYGHERYLHQVVASVLTLRRHDPERPIALYCTEEQIELLERHGLDTLFALLHILPEAHRSIVGFKHHLHRFMPFDRNLFVDADMVWCRNPDPLWQQLAAFPVTATGLPRADFFFGGPKGIGILGDILRDRRRATMRRFGLSYLPRVQAGMIFAQDHELTRQWCEAAQAFLAQQPDTHFRSRLKEGRAEESCEWSMAMAMSCLNLPLFLWHQGHNSPQLDFIEGMTEYDAEFERVFCDYYSDPFVYSLRGLPKSALRDVFIRLFAALPGKGDRMKVMPYALHFSWLHHKEPFLAFADRIWKRITQPVPQYIPAGYEGDGALRGTPVL
jgi:hypothetical protein